MKKFRMPAFVLALGLAVMCAFAFTPHPVAKNGHFNTQYFYHGPDQAIAHLKVDGNWNTTDPGCSTGGSKVCGILGDNDRPTFIASLQNYSTQSAMLAAADLTKP